MPAMYALATKSSSLDGVTNPTCGRCRQSALRLFLRSHLFQLANPCTKVPAPKRTMVTCLDAVEASRPRSRKESPSSFRNFGEL